MPGFDYGSSGAYFVTVCAWRRECVFGDVIDGDMRLNPIGKIVDEEWRLSATLRSEIELDAWVVMPNHVHGIVILIERDVGAIHELPLQRLPLRQTPPRVPVDAPDARRRMAIPLMMGRFKTVSAKRINQMRGTPGLPVWQRNYHEHIIRNDESLGRIRQYIAANPARWPYDRENPAAGMGFSIRRSPPDRVPLFFRVSMQQTGPSFR